MPPRKGWAVELEGVVISGSGDPGDGCLVAPPEGLGNPPLRTEDVTFPQRDGVRHFADWYEPRIITLEATVCGGDGCGRNCPGAREHVRNILKAWGRKCDDVELIVWTDCSDSLPCPTGESPGAVPDKIWPLNGPAGTAVTLDNSNLARVDPAGGTITYKEGGGIRLTSALGGSFTVASGTDSDAATKGSQLYVFSIPALPAADLTFGHVLQLEDMTPAVSFTVTPTGQIFLTDYNGNTVGTGPVGAVHPGAVYQLTLVMDVPAGIVNARLYTETGTLIGEQSTTTAYLGIADIIGFDIGVLSSNPATSVDFYRVKMAGGATTEIPPEGQPGIQDRSLVGPYGIIGRPRLATVQWLRGRSGCARLTLRFDARDHRMFILDCEGGTGEVCVRAEPNIEVMGRPYPRCYPMCYSCETSIDSGDAIATVVGDECASPTVCFNGQLTNPILENQTTGETIGFFGVIGATDLPVCIDTETGTATQGGASRTHLITGNPQMRLVPGENVLRLTSTEATDNGHVDVCFRPFVVSA